MTKNQDTHTFKARFCPSPSGWMHIGNARMALLNWLLVQREKGVLVLRIEDTDMLRSQEIYLQGLLDDLRWLGLDWQGYQSSDTLEEGQSTYRQSARQAIYDDFYRQLNERGLVYPCFCDVEMLKTARVQQLKAGQPPRYTGQCRHLVADQIEQRYKEGIKPVLRFKTDHNMTISFTDAIYGKQVMRGFDIDDFILRRANGTPTFIFCNAVDDACMGITMVLRGADHLSNTPRQILLLRSLGLSEPTYAHIALITGSNHDKLSKRSGSLSIKELREKGFWPQAVNNYLARLGHYNPQDQHEVMSLAALAESFSIKFLQKAPACYDEKQLLFWQRQVLERVSADIWWSWCRHQCDSTLLQNISPSQEHAFFELIRHNVTFPADVNAWLHCFYNPHLNWSDSQKMFLDQVSSDFWEKADTLWQTHTPDFKTWSQVVQSSTQRRGKSFFQALRLALTARSDGPNLADLFKFLGESWLSKRLQQIKCK